MATTTKSLTFNQQVKHLDELLRKDPEGMGIFVWVNVAKMQREILVVVKQEMSAVKLHKILSNIALILWSTPMWKLIQQYGVVLHPSTEEADGSRRIFFTVPDNLMRNK